MQEPDGQNRCIKKMKKSDNCEEICVKALISKNNSTCKKRRFTGSVWKLNAPGDGLLVVDDTEDVRENKKLTCSIRASLNLYIREPAVIG